MDEHDTIDPRGAAVVLALRDLGDDLVAARSGGTDPVAGALADIGAVAAPGRTSATRARSVVRLGPSRSSRRTARPSRWAWPARRPARRVVAAVVAGIVLAGGLAVAAPGPRGAVADLLGIGGVAIVPRDELPGGDGRTHGTGGPDGTRGSGRSDEDLLEGVSRDLGLGENLPVDEALAAAPAPMEVGGAGDADAAFTGLPEGAVTLAWAADDDLPVIEAVAPTGWGLILTAFPGTPETPTIVKAPEPLTTVTAVTVSGRSGYWVADWPHSVVVDPPKNKPGGMTARLAGNTLLWTVGDVTYRLESNLGRDAAIALAETIPLPAG